MRALRLEPAEDLLLLLPGGGAVRARWDGRACLELEGPTAMPQLPLLSVTLATAWPKGPRADDLVVRATEAGVERIVPLHCERSVAGRETLPAGRMQRWERLAREVCQQAGRPRPPAIEAEPKSPSEAQAAAPHCRAVALQPGTRALGAELSRHAPGGLLLMVGPEGGWAPAELERFGDHRVALAGLVPTTLRIESAGPLGVAIAQHWYLQTLSD